MRPNIRDVRKRKGLSLGEVASRCTPPTTPQTIGRLETGMRTLSLAWVDRIASALDVRPDDLFVRTGETSAQVAAVLRRGGAYAPKLESTVAPAEPGLCDVAVTVEDGTGEYRSGDQIWCERITVEAFKKALNRDILVPCPDGRFLFGRLIGRDNGKLYVMPVGAGQRQHIVNDPPWLAVASKLTRTL